MKNSVGNAGFFASLIQATGTGTKGKGKGKTGLNALFGASFLKVTAPSVKQAVEVTKKGGELKVSSDVLKQLMDPAKKEDVKEALKKIAQEIDKLGETLGIDGDLKKKIEKLLNSEGEINEKTLEAVLFSFVEVLATLKDLQQILTTGGLKSLSLKGDGEVTLTEMATMLEEVTQNIKKDLAKAGVSPKLLDVLTSDSKATAKELVEPSQLSTQQAKAIETVLERVRKGHGKSTKPLPALAERGMQSVKGAVPADLPAQIQTLISRLKGSVSQVKRVVAKASDKGQKLEALDALKGKESLEKALSEKEIAIRPRSAKAKGAAPVVKEGVHPGATAMSSEKGKLADLLNFSAEIAQNTSDGDEIVQSKVEKSVSVGKSTGPKQVGYSSLAERLFESQIMQQVTSKVGQAVKEGLHVINIKLRPEHLGDVSIKLQVEGDVVTAKINVESQQVKQIIENNFQSLRDSLEEQSLFAGSLDVNVGGDGSAEFKDFAEEFGFGNQGSYSDEIFEEDGLVLDAIGIDTGRRFGTNSFEYRA